MTVLECAKKNLMTPLVKKVAKSESLNHRLLLRRIAEGKVVIPANRTRQIIKPCAVGCGLRTKVNANIGTSPDKCEIQDELKKLAVAIKYGADTVMDLSIGGDLEKIRRKIIENSQVPVGTVPIYEIAAGAQKKRGNLLKFDFDDVMRTLESQAKQGVDFITIHCGVTKRSLKVLSRHQRLLGIVSRGGAILASWIKYHRQDNPFYEHFDKILDIAYEYDITLSLGDGLRPGSILDATDEAQICELKILGELTQRAKARNVQVIIEGPGHVPLNQIERNVRLEKKICQDAPFYVLGPLVTDIAAGYDHVSAAIGGALAASYGADFLCYVTPSEHLRHPSIEDVREGVIVSKIAAHAADIAKGIKSAIQWDKKMSEARRKRDWKKQIKLSIDPQKARYFRASSKPHLPGVCTMCGEYCSIKLMQDCLRA